MDTLEFSEGRSVPLGKVFAALARKRSWVSLYFQGETGWGVLAEVARGIAAMKFCCEALRICAVGVWRKCGMLAGC